VCLLEDASGDIVRPLVCLMKGETEMGLDAHIDADVVEVLARAGWSRRVLTGVGKWVLLDLSSFGLALCQAIGIQGKPEGGFVGVDFREPKNLEALDAFARHIEARGNEQGERRVRGC
jgi:hypothetical protein